MKEYAACKYGTCEHESKEECIEQLSGALAEACRIARDRLDHFMKAHDQVKVLEKEVETYQRYYRSMLSNLDQMEVIFRNGKGEYVWAVEGDFENSPVPNPITFLKRKK